MLRSTGRNIESLFGNRHHCYSMETGILVDERGVASTRLARFWRPTRPVESGHIRMFEKEEELSCGRSGRILPRVDARTERRGPSRRPTSLDCVCIVPKIT